MIGVFVSKMHEKGRCVYMWGGGAVDTNLVITNENNLLAAEHERDHAFCGRSEMSDIHAMRYANTRRNDHTHLVLPLG